MSSKWWLYDTPATFEELIEKVLQGVVRAECLSYLINILVLCLNK